MNLQRLAMRAIARATVALATVAPAVAGDLAALQPGYFYLMRGTVTMNGVTAPSRLVTVILQREGSTVSTVDCTPDVCMTSDYIDGLVMTNTARGGHPSITTRFTGDVGAALSARQPGKFAFPYQEKVLRSGADGTADYTDRQGVMTLSIGQPYALNGQRVMVMDIVTTANAMGGAPTVISSRIRVEDGAVVAYSLTDPANNLQQTYVIEGAGTLLPDDLRKVAKFAPFALDNDVDLCQLKIAELPEACARRFGGVKGQP
jgi:hypothetical protein